MAALCSIPVLIGASQVEATLDNCASFAATTSSLSELKIDVGIKERERRETFDKGVNHVSASYEYDTIKQQEKKSLGCTKSDERRLNHINRSVHQLNLFLWMTLSKLTPA